MNRILALDFGLRRTGIAVTDEMNIIASGLTTVDSRDLMKYLQTEIPKLGVGIIVLGEPKRLNNEDTHSSENVRQLKIALEKNFPLQKIVMVDERFTSKMAFQTMIDSGLKKKQRRNKAMVDEISATLILQSYMQSTRM